MDGTWRMDCHICFLVWGFCLFVCLYVQYGEWSVYNIQLLFEKGLFLKEMVASLGRANLFWKLGAWVCIPRVLMGKLRQVTQQKAQQGFNKNNIKGLIEEQVGSCRSRCFTGRSEATTCVNVAPGVLGGLQSCY